MIVAGGPVRRATARVVGAAAVDLIRQFKVDFAVIGASAIDEDGALLDFDYREVRVAQAIIEQCAPRHPGRRPPEVRALRAGSDRPFSQIDVFVTDRLPIGSAARLPGLRRAMLERRRPMRRRQLLSRNRDPRARSASGRASALISSLAFEFFTLPLCAIRSFEQDSASSSKKRNASDESIGEEAPGRSRVFDLAIIGGGINGCGIARDAAGRGAVGLPLRAGRPRRAAPPRASTKLIHGGLRYLEYYEFRLVREALMEREVLWRMAPHIVWPLRFVLPHHNGLRPAWLLRLGLFLYDHLGGRKLLPPTAHARPCAATRRARR